MSEWTFVGFKPYEGKQLRLVFGPPDEINREGTYIGKLIVLPDPKRVAIELLYFSSNHNREFPFPRGKHPVWQHLRNISYMCYNPENFELYTNMHSARFTSDGRKLR
jgi:hypothetical protein